MKQSPYIAWAKRHHGITYNLASSGVTPLSDEALGIQGEGRHDSGEQEDGWAPVLERIARRYGVEPSSVVLAPGASMANYLVYALLVEPGQSVVVERPVYEPLRVLPLHLHANLRFFERRPEEGYTLSPRAVETAVDARTRLVVLTNLHNPTGQLATRPALEALASLAETRGFHVLVDEVYLEWLYDEGERTAALLGPRLITTRSLTKAFGLDSLRAGWILAEPETAERLRRLIDLFYVKMPHPIEKMAASAIDQAEGILTALKRRLGENRAIVAEFVESRPELSWIPPAGGSIGWVRLRKGSVEDLMVNLEALDTAVAPGHFFGVGDHFRLGFGMDKAKLVEGLHRLDDALGLL